MGEIMRELRCLEPYETFQADEDGAFVITAKHTHKDILRYVVSDIGVEEVMFLLSQMSTNPSTKG